MTKIALFMFLMMTSVALADDTKSDGTTKVPEDVVITVPGSGPDVVVNVPYPVPQIHEFTPAPGNLRLRGGFSAAAGFPARSYPSLTDGLIGEIGHADSQWRLQATFRAGSCKEGWGDLALDSGLAVMRSVNKHFRAGLGADLMYCANVSSHPQEKSGERILGGSFLLNVEITNHLVVGGSIGMGAATIPTPGDRDTQLVLYGGVNMSHLWGK